jgi:hypothetical protein
MCHDDRFREEWDEPSEKQVNQCDKYRERPRLFDKLAVHYVQGLPRSALRKRSGKC